MKLLKTASAESGELKKVKLEVGDDPWVVYTLLEQGDVVEGTSSRKVASGGGIEPSSARFVVRVRLRVHSAEFDGQADTVRVHGRNELENKHVPLGAFHALEAGVGDELAIVKPNRWNTDDWHLLKSACNPEKDADTLLVLVQEGLAYVLAVSSLRTVPKGKVETKLPRKRGAFSEKARAKSLQAFYSRVAECLALALQHRDRDVRIVLLAGPGNGKDALLAYIHAEAEKHESLAPLRRCADAITTAHTPDPYPHAVPNILAQRDIAKRLEGARVAREAAALEQWNQLLATEPARAPFGEDDVKHAHEMGAIGTLLLSDSLYRSKQPEQRAEWRNIASEVESLGGECLVASTAHATGQRIDKLAKAVAILRFPLPDIDIT